MLKGQSYDKTRLEIVHAPAVVTGNDVPTEAVRKMTDSSLVKGLDLLASDDEAQAFVSTEPPARCWSERT